MKIALVHPRMDIPGGAERLISWLAAAMAERGMDVTICTRSFKPELWPGFKGRVNIKVLEGSFLSRLFTSKVMLASSLGRELAVFLKGFDLVTSFNFPSYWWVSEAKRLSDAFPRTVWFCNEPLKRFYRVHADRHISQLKDYTEYTLHLKEEKERRLKEDIKNARRLQHDIAMDKKAVLSMDRILAVSNFTAGNLKDIFGVDVKTCFLGIPLIENIPPPESRVRQAEFLTVGWVSPAKNLKNVLAAARILAGKRKDFKLKIIGYNPGLKTWVEKVAAEEGVSDNICLPGHISDEELFKAYTDALGTIYIPIDEAFGLVVIESMMCGTPVIVSDHGGPADVIKDRITGVQVDPFDPIKVAEAMELFLTDKELITEMGRNGYRIFRENFTVEHFVDRFLNMALN